MVSKWSILLLVSLLTIVCNVFSQKRDTLYWDVPVFSLPLFHDSDTVVLTRKNINPPVPELVIIASPARFRSALFMDATIRFDQVNFGDTADFYRSHFYSSTYFYHTSFHSTANFRRTQFDKTTYFIQTNFDADVDFSLAEFSDTLILMGIKTTDKTNFRFDQAILPQVIDFSHNSYLFDGKQKSLDLTVCNFRAIDSINKPGLEYFFNYVWQLIKDYFIPSNKEARLNNNKHRINLYHTDVSKVHIDYSHFGLYFQATEDHNGKRSLFDDEIKSIYESLLKNFKDRGQTESYKLLDIEYHLYREGKQAGDFSWWDFWWRFGYEKERVFKHIAVLVLFFTLVNWIFIRRLNRELYPVEWLPEKRFFAALVYTIVLFFFLTLKVDKVRFSKSASVWILFIHATGLLCIGYLANFIFQK